MMIIFNSYVSYIIIIITIIIYIILHTLVRSRASNKSFGMAKLNNLHIP